LRQIFAIHAFEMPNSCGPLESPVLPSGWDMLVTVAFSVAIYFWAMRVCLTTDKINQMMEEVVLPEEEGMGMPTH
jgi:hypothetical protein